MPPATDAPVVTSVAATTSFSAVPVRPNAEGRITSRPSRSPSPTVIVFPDESEAAVAVTAVICFQAVFETYVFDVPVAVTLHVSVRTTPYTSTPVITPLQATMLVACVTVTTTFRPPVNGPKVGSSVAFPPLASEPVIVRLIVAVFGPACATLMPLATFAEGLTHC